MDFHLCCTKVQEIVFETEKYIPRDNVLVSVEPPPSLLFQSAVEPVLTDDRVLKYSHQLKLKI